MRPQTPRYLRGKSPLQSGRQLNAGLQMSCSTPLTDDGHAGRIELSTTNANPHSGTLVSVGRRTSQPPPIERCASGCGALPQGSPPP